MMKSAGRRVAPKRARESVDPQAVGNALKAVAGDTAEQIAKDIRAVANISAIPTLLQVLCETTGMGFAAVARVSAETWTACAVKDNIGFGLRPGSQLDVKTTLCHDSRASGAPIVIDHASTDPHYSNHHAIKLYQIESHVSVPIVLANGRYFGNLCAIDRAPASVSDPRIISMFTRFAQLIALQLDGELAREREHAALLDERAAGELREQFIAILGHDLRNPLQAIYATGDLLEKKLTDPALSVVASRIKVNVRRMSALIDHVLDFARGRLGGGIELQMSDSDDINSGLQAVVQEFQDGRPDREIMANISVTRTVRCDVGRIQQVASNLIGNALTHGSPQSPIKVMARIQEDDFVLQVWNAGEPIPADSIGKIFEPFWRQTLSADREGLGLGLHISSQIVRAHGGKLSVESTKEGGTEFTARLPLKTQPESSHRRNGTKY